MGFKYRRDIANGFISFDLGDLCVGFHACMELHHSP